MGTRTVLVADDEIHGFELWVTDGSPAGTKLLTDISPGGGYPEINRLVSSGDRVFFAANDGVNGKELWVSDGTTAGTKMVKDLAAGAGGSEPTAIHAYKGGAVFVASTDSAPTGLWFTDGTAAGTKLLKRLAREKELESYINEKWMVAGSQFYFTYPDEDGHIGRELWKTDGTPAGTVLVKDILPGGNGSSPYPLGVVGSTLYFTAMDMTRGIELWKTNGTATGTVSVKDVSPEFWAGYSDTVAIGTKAYFMAGAGFGSDIWVTDGTPAGTEKVALDPALVAGFRFEGAMETSLLAHDGKLYIPMEEKDTIVGQGAGKLLVYDPATKTTTQVYSSASNPGMGTMRFLRGIGSRVIFCVVDDGEYSLWSTTGTAASMVRITDDSAPAKAILPGPVVGQMFVYSAFDSGGISSLWSSNGMGSGTSEILRLTAKESSSYARDLVRVGSRIFFSAEDGVHGRELWVTDGTAAGTVMVKDIYPGKTGSEPEKVVEMNGIVYFGATDAAGGRELWRSDGTEAGTYRVCDIIPGTADGNVSDLTVMNNRIYFAATATATGRELWASDGTEAGTAIVANINADTGGNILSSYPNNLMAMNGQLYFEAQRAGIWRLFRSGGTGATDLGTFNDGILKMAVRPPVPGAALAPSQSVLYLVTGGPGGRRSLNYIINGSSTVTLVSELGFPVEVTQLEVIGEYAFVATTSDYYQSSAVTRFDGTPSGTRVVLPPPAPMQHAGFSAMGEHLCLWGVTQDETPGLWLMKPTDDNGVTVAGPLPSFRTGRTATHVGGNAVFLYSQLSAGRAELWRILGAGGRVEKVPKVELQEAGASLASGSFNPVQMGSRLYFPGSQLATGHELFSLDISGRLEVESRSALGHVKSLSTGATLDMGRQQVGSSLKTTLKLSNAGELDLEDLDLILPEASAFHLSAEHLETLAAGTVVEIEVTFTPTAASAQTAVLAIRQGETALTQITLSAAGLAENAAQVALEVSPPQLVLAGAEVTFQASFAALGTPVSYAWTRDGKAVGTQAALLLPSVKLTDAGTYLAQASSPKGRVTSAPTTLTVVAPAPASARAPDGKSITLVCDVRAAKGAALTYQWLRNGSPLADDSRILGSRKPTLVINQFSLSDCLAYECLVTLTSGDWSRQISAGKTAVDILYAPTVYVDSYPVDFIGETVQFQFQTDQPATRFTVSGLPPGLSMNASGLVTGRPTKPRPVNPDTGKPMPYSVKVSASNAVGAGEILTFDWQVVPLMEVGTYVGLIDRDARLDGMAEHGLGSQVKFTVTSSGALSGQLQHQGKTFSLASPRLTDADASSGEGNAVFILSRSKPQPALKLTLRVSDSGYDVILKTEDDQEPWAPPGTLRRAMTKNDSVENYAGLYTIALNPELDGELEEFPQGHGYLTATVSKTGIMTWKGKLADGTAISGSNPLTTEESWYNWVYVPVYQVLYRTKGSIDGWMRLSHAYQAAQNVWIDGAFGWVKHAQPGSKERLYKDGIVYSCFFVGSKYYPPAKNRLVGDLPQTEDNLQCRFTSFGLAATISQSLTLPLSHKISVKTQTNTAPLKSLTITPGTGVFKGTFVLKDPDPTAPSRQLTRTVNFEGVLNHEGGFGFFLLPDLPTEGPPKTTLSTSPILSGCVEIHGQ